MGRLFNSQMQQSQDLLGDLFGEPTPRDQMDLSVAAQMYSEVLMGGGNHRQAYAMLVDECGPDLADRAVSYAKPSWRETQMSQDGNRLYGETRTEQAMRQAGLAAAWLP